MIFPITLRQNDSTYTYYGIRRDIPIFSPKNKTDNNKKSNDMFLLYGLEIVGMHSNIELFNQNCFFSGP